MTRGTLWESWGPVLFRDYQLEVLEARMNEARGAFLDASERLHEHIMGLVAQAHAAVAPVPSDLWANQQRAVFHVRMEAETVLLFAVAALNNLADTLAELGRFTRPNVGTAGYGDLRSAIKNGAHPLHALEPATDRIYFAVVHPRAVIIAHPWAEMGTGGIIRQGDQVKLTASVAFYPNEAAKDALPLFAAAAHLSPPPLVVGEPSGMYLRDWLMQDASVLNKEGQKALKLFMSKYGCNVDPCQVAALTREHIAEVARACGADWQTGQQELRTFDGYGSS